MSNERYLTLPVSRLAAWRSERARLQSEIESRQEMIAAIDKKLNAVAELNLVERPPYVDATTVTPTVAPESEDGPLSATDALLHIMRTQRQGLKPPQVREHMSKAGFGTRIESNRNFVHALLSRLKKSGKLEQRGELYFIAQIESPEGGSGVHQTPAH